MENNKKGIIIGILIIVFVLGCAIVLKFINLTKARKEKNTYKAKDKVRKQIVDSSGNVKTVQTTGKIIDVKTGLPSVGNMSNGNKQDTITQDNIFTHINH